MSTGRQVRVPDHIVQHATGARPTAINANPTRLARISSIIVLIAGCPAASSYGGTITRRRDPSCLGKSLHCLNKIKNLQNKSLKNPAKSHVKPPNPPSEQITKAKSIIYTPKYS